MVCVCVVWIATVPSLSAVLHVVIATVPSLSAVLNPLVLTLYVALLQLYNDKKVFT